MKNLFRFCSLMLSWAVCANVLAQIADPVISSVGDACNTVAFKVDNYDASQYSYTAQLNGAPITLAADGSYSVANPIRNVPYTLSVTCTSSGTSSNTVSQSATLPKAVATPRISADANACDAPVQFTIDNYDPSLTYVWTINGDLCPATGDTYSVSVPVDGTKYDASVLATDGCTSATSNTASQTYVKTPVKPSISVNHTCGYPITFKLDNNSDYTANNSLQWILNSTPLTPTPTSGEYKITNFNDGDSFTLEIVATNTANSACKSSESVSVAAKVVPNSPAVTNYEVCETTGSGRWADLVTKSDPSYTLKWYNSSSDTATPISTPADFNKSAIGTKEYWVAQVNGLGCESAKTSVKVTVYAKPRISLGSDLTICYGETAVLASGKIDESGVVYEWQPSTLLTSSNKYSVETIPLYSEETFTLVAYNDQFNSCSSTEDIKVKVLSKPEIILVPDEFTICEGGQVIIENDAADDVNERYRWESTTDDVTYTTVGAGKDLTLRNITKNTTIKLTSSLRSLNTCSTTANAKVTVVNKPKADAGPDRYICDGKPVQIGGSSPETAVKYQWDNAAKLNDANKYNPTVLSVTEYTEFTLIASSELVAGCESKDKVEVYKVEMPTVYNLKGGGQYCLGYSTTSGINVELDGSDSGAEYLLMKDGVAFGTWEQGTNSSIVWPDMEAGRYKVKARTINPDNNTCEVYMNGEVVVAAEQSPTANISLKGSSLACPGDEVTIRVDIISGGGPYEFDLITDGGTPVTINTGNAKFYEFKHTLSGPTTFEINRVKDGICERNYTSSTDPGYPILELSLPHEADLEIKMSPNKAAACPGENVTLSVNYTDALSYLWSTGATGRSIRVAASVDTEYKLEIVTLEGCSIPKTFKLDVIEEVPLTVTLDHYSTDGNGDTFWYYCSNEEGPFIPVASQPGGSYSSNPAGLFDSEGRIKPKDILPGKYELIYTFTDVGSGCKQEHKENVYVSEVNKVVDWALAPAFDPPWPEKAYSKCVDDPANPVTAIRLQGHPKVDAGKWNIVKVENPGGATSGATVVETNSPLAEAQLKNPTAGVTYHISYSVRDEFGCVGEAVKTLEVIPRPTGSIGSIGFDVAPSPNLCKNLEEATIRSLNNPVKFILSGSDNAMRISPNANTSSTELKINPSKGSLGSHYVIVDAGPTGCEDKDKVYFNIVNPISITSFNIPTEYCQGDDPVTITVTSSVPTTGEIEILDELGSPFLNRTDISLAPKFNPYKAGKFKVIYHYNDGTCDTDQSIDVEVFPLPVIDFQMKSDYCYGEKIEMIPNYTGGEFSSDTPLPAGVLVGNYFDTSLLEDIDRPYTIKCKVTDQKGCKNEASTTFYVHGVKPMSVSVDPIFCDPSGVWPIQGFPGKQKSGDVVKFSSTRFNKITDNGNATGTIDLTDAVFNTTYPLTYHYIQEYTDAAGTLQTCETTTTSYFKVLNQVADFSGYDDGETICADVLKIELKAAITENSTFSVSNNMLPYPDAFKDNGDGTAVLYPEELPEGKNYAITVNHKYYDETTGNLICETEKTKTFNISKIEEVTDISLFCDPAVDNNIAVKINNSELGIQYDLMVDGVKKESLTSTTAGEELKFTALNDEEAHIQVIAIDPTAIRSCYRQMSKEFNIKKLRAFIKEKKDISCNGEVDGLFKGGTEGGVEPYSYKIISSTAGVNVDISDSQDSRLPKSSYEYVVTDDLGCFRTVTFEIKEPTLLDAEINQTDVACFEASTASVAAIIKGNSGTAPYSYSWMNLGTGTIVSTEATMNDIPAGTYEVTIKDANGCPKILNTTISAPTEPLTVKLKSKVDVSIHGQSTGAIDIEVEGGTPDPVTNEYKEYLWVGNGVNNTNKNLQDLSNIVAGDYTVWVTDFNDCKKSLTVKIEEPTTFKAEETISNVSCSGLQDGSIYINVLGGTEPYASYKWTDTNNNVVGTDKDLTNQPAGSYHLEIKDKVGDTYENTYTITEPLPLDVKTSIQSRNLELKCNGDKNAIIEIEVFGGTKNYTVDWVGLDASHLENDFRATGLKAGTYNIDIKDANGCTISHTEVVKEPANKFTLLNETVEQNICHGASVGKIDINLTGGTVDPTTGLYHYSWTGEGVDPSAEDQQNLKAGEEYYVKATDANGCTWEKTYLMTNPDELTIALTTKDLTCNIATDGFSADGLVEAVVTGGVTPYTYEWTKSSTLIPTVVNQITDLEEGDYEVKVTDALGCSITAQTHVSQPELLTATVRAKDISCSDANDGWLEVVPTGGTKDYTYAWYKLPNTSAPESTNSKIENLSDDVYSIKVLDANGCPWTTPNLYNSYRPSPIEIKPTVQDVTIYGEATGKISLAILGGTINASGYKIEWFRGPSIVTDPTDPGYNANKAVLENILSGDYYVVVTDVNGCASDANIYVSQPEVISVDVEIVNLTCNKSNDGSITIKTIEGGDGIYSYSWVGLDKGFTSNSKDISLLEADTYKLTVTDGAGATFTKEYIVTEPEEISITTNTGKSKLAVDCHGNSNGKITVDIAGGTTPYTYKWIGVTANNVNTVDNLPAGGYAISLEDDNGCKHNSYTETISGPTAPLAITSIVIENKCDGDAQGVVEINVSGGTPDPVTGEYRYLWTGAGIDPLEINNQNQYKLHDGIAYKVTVMDALDCTIDEVFTMAQRDKILVETTVKNVDCNGQISGELHAVVSGGTGVLSPKWEKTDGSFSDTNLDVFNRPAGEYTFTVTDDAGCVVSVEEEITQPDVLTANLTGSTTLCGGVDHGE